jgi:hypothetical protein
MTVPSLENTHRLPFYFGSQKRQMARHRNRRGHKLAGGVAHSSDAINQNQRINFLEFAADASGLKTRGRIAVQRLAVIGIREPGPRLRGRIVQEEGERSKRRSRYCAGKPATCQAFVRTETTPGSNAIT